jgi:hypothetical protein
MSGVLRLPIFVATVAAAATLCAGAEADTVTIGSPLTADFSTPVKSASAIGTWANIELPEAGARIASPISGTVVRWRVKGAFSGGPFSLQVLRPAGAGAYAGVATSSPQSPYGEEFKTDLPIQAGDVVGLLTSHPSDAIGATVPTAGVNASEWIPPLADGGAATLPQNFDIEDELGFNADVESAPTIGPPAPAPTAPPPTSASTCTVPKLKGKKLKLVKKALAKADCKLGGVKRLDGVTATAGKVKAQSPKAGEVLAGVKLGV